MHKDEPSQKNFDAQLASIYEIAGCGTQLALANILDIRQSSVSDAKRRNGIPSDWLVKLLKLYGANPDWIRNGTGVKFLTTSETPVIASCPYEDIARKILRCFTLKDLEHEVYCRKVKTFSNGLSDILSADDA